MRFDRRTATNSGAETISGNLWNERNTLKGPSRRYTKKRRQV
jgi:hypothetical protein